MDIADCHLPIAGWLHAGGLELDTCYRKWYRLYPTQILSFRAKPLEPLN